jgi:hypothetical protein
MAQSHSPVPQAEEASQPLSSNPSVITMESAHLQEPPTKKTATTF